MVQYSIKGKKSDKMHFMFYRYLSTATVRPGSRSLAGGDNRPNRAYFLLLFLHYIQANPLKFEGWGGGRPGFGPGYSRISIQIPFNLFYALWNVSASQFAN